MRKYRNKILLMVALVFLFATMLATTAFCLEGESITITFNQSIGISDSFSAVEATGGDMITLPKGTAPNGYSYVWIPYSEENSSTYIDYGSAYMGGSKVVFNESAVLRPIYAYDVETESDFYAFLETFDDYAFKDYDSNMLSKESDFDRYITVRLISDITLTKAIELKTYVGSYLNIILNGYTLTIDESVDCVFGGTRFGTKLYGSGTVKYDGTGSIVRLDSSDQTGAEKNSLLVGRTVYIDAPNATLAKDSSDLFTANHPHVGIYGTVNCKTILEVASEVKRNPRISIYPRAYLTLNGNLFEGTIPFIATITGGTIVTTDSNISLFNSSSTYVITGGSFYLAMGNADETTLDSLLGSSYKAYERFSYGTDKYKTIFPTSCGKLHKYSVIETYSANCSHATETIYQCGTCSKIAYVSSDTPLGHTFDDKTTIKNPTPTERGEIVKHCTLCGCENYTFLLYNPLNDLAEIVIDTGDGQTQIVGIKVSDIFEIDDNYKISGIKDVGDYTADQVVGIIVPAGIKSLDFTIDNATLKRIVLADGLDIEIISLAKLSALETIEIGKVANVVFYANCAPNSLKSIITTVEGGEITFGDNAFDGKSGINELVLLPNTKYTFGASSFKGVGIKKLALVDNSNISFSGAGAFSGSSIEELYVGKGIIKLENKPFESVVNLKKVILMDVVSLSDGDFSNNGTGACVVYHHGSSLTLGENTFGKSHGITIYTTAAVTTGFKDCSAFTIIKNIKHAYTIGAEKDPSCTEEGYISFVTDCPCGENEGTRADIFENVYTNSTATGGNDYSNKKFQMLEHVSSENAVIKYLNGYTKEGNYVKECVMCKGALTESATSCPPLIKSLGYSVSEENSGAGGMVVKYIFNTEILEQYIQGKDVEYGTVFAIRDLLGDDTPLDENGDANSTVIKLNGGNVDYASYLMKMSNINDAQKNLGLIMAAYVIEDGKITYIQDNEAVSNPSGVTYNEVKELSDYKQSLGT